MINSGFNSIANLQKTLRKSIGLIARNANLLESAIFTENCWKERLQNPIHRP